VQQGGNTEKSPYLFTSKELDEETGLYYFGARYYDPRTSVWQSADPILSSVLGNQDAFEELPRKLSLYAYSRLNPVVFRDPDGRDYEILIGGSYSGHPYGHAALRVFGEGYDVTYDFGRYAGETSLGQGPGALRVWDNSFSKYIAGENATGRTTDGYAFKTSKEEDMAAMAHFGSQIADASKTTSDKRGFKQHILKENYHAVDKNCTTMCISGVQAGKSDLGGKLSDPKESKGRGLNWLEKQMAGEVGEKIFMPADLKANIEAGGGYYKHNEYKSGQEVQQ
jgi:RHS repeat-associated protein